MPNTPAFDPLFDSDLIRRALAEDVGRGDVTTQATIAPGTQSSARIVAREAGVIAGLPIAALTFAQLDANVQFATLTPDGTAVAAGTTLARVTGDAAALLTAERTALNFLGRLSGIASQAARCVAAVAGTGAKIVDTRKTTPGLRLLEKYAVRMGGAQNHRAGLDDGILIKDNHIAAAGSLTLAVERARAHASHLLKIEVECDSETQVREAIAARADAILLDNMTPDQLRSAVTLIREQAPGIIIEASGNIGVDPRKLEAVAATGVDLISLGALTHSAPNFDVALDFES
jgi:nicotinate-nucleotide pyrophosphorylase (carboxylating)